MKSYVIQHYCSRQPLSGADYRKLGNVCCRKPTKESNRSRNLSQTNQQHNSNPQQIKTSIPTKIKHRLITLPITKPNYKKELRYIEEMAVKNGFNLKTIH